MENSSHRSVRISQELKKNIAFIVNCILRDPRIKNIITVCGVKLSSDLSHAQVFVSFLDDDNINKIKKKLTILNKASGFIRKTLCTQMKLRIIPNIIFYYDNSLFKGNQINIMLKSISQK